MGRRRSGYFVGGRFGGAVPKEKPSRTLSGSYLPSTNNLYVQSDMVASSNMDLGTVL